MEQIPKWLEGIANESDLHAIQAAVESAESKTTGEIVPMIVHRSITTGHVRPLVTLALFLLFFSALLTIEPYLEFMRGQHVWAALTFIFFTGTPIALGWWASKLDKVQRIFTKSDDQAISAIRRAQLEFFETDIPATQERTGVLIFVSLLEHQAVVLGDRAITEKIPAEAWKKIVEEMVVKIRDGKFRDAYTDAIARCGEILAREFPIQPGDRNELANRLVIQE